MQWTRNDDNFGLKHWFFSFPWFLSFFGFLLIVVFCLLVSFWDCGYSCSLKNAWLFNVCWRWIPRQSSNATVVWIVELLLIYRCYDVWILVTAFFFCFVMPPWLWTYVLADGIWNLTFTMNCWFGFVNLRAVPFGA